MELHLYNISVIIPTFQRKEFITSNIFALKNQTFIEPFEVICIIDGSTDGTYEALRELEVPFPFTIIVQKNKGAAAARNAGVKIAKGKILLFLDDDMEADPNLLTEHWNSHLKGANIVTGHMPYHYETKKTPIFQWYQRWSELRLNELNQKKELDYKDFLTGQISVERDLFFEVQGFDETYNLKNSYGHEDLDLGYRLLQSVKANFVFNPKAISFQKFDTSFEESLTRKIKQGQNCVYFIRKHPESGQLFFANDLHKKWVYFFRDSFIHFSLVFPIIIKFISWFLSKLALFLYNLKLNTQIKYSFFSSASTVNFWKGVVIAGGIPSSLSVKTLSYHSISNNIDKEDVTTTYSVSTEDFEKQIKILKKIGYQFIIPLEFQSFINGKSVLPRKAVLLTFDDGYIDFMENALPVLEAEGVTGILFIPSGLIGSYNEWDVKIGAHKKLLLNRENILTLEKKGFSIGGHSTSHQNLSKLSVSDLKLQIEKDLMNFKELNIKSPFVFAYPYGVYNNTVVETVSNAGYSAGLTTNNGYFGIFKNPFGIPRLVIRRHHNILIFLIRIIAGGRFKRD